MYKMLGMAAVAAAALMVYIGSASATTLTSPAGSTYTGSVTLETVEHTILHNSFTTTECNWRLEGKVEQHGAGVTVISKISTLHVTGCTGANTPTSPVAQPGTLELHSVAGTNDSTVTWSGAAIKFTNHAFGGTCIYTTSNTDIGVLTGSSSTSSTAILDLSANLPRTGGTLGVFCGSTGAWTGQLRVVTPDSLNVDA